MAEAELRESMERAFKAYGKPLENVSDSKYLGRVITAGDEDWPEVAGNLSKARKSWGRFSRILCQEGSGVRVSDKVFKAVVQAVLLFGEETWVLTPRMEWALDSFQNGAARRLTGRQPRRRGEGRWTYPPLKEATREAGFGGIRKSITRRQNTVAQYIATQPIMDLCEWDTQRLGARVSRRWWEQEVIDLERQREGRRKRQLRIWSQRRSWRWSQRSGGGGVSGSSGEDWSRAE